MGRPVEIPDAEVITAGRALEDAGKLVNAFRLHRGVDNRGRPDRLLAVWSDYTARSGAKMETPKELPPLPQAVREELVALNTLVGERLERTVRVIADELATEAQTRVQADLNGLAREREVLAATERNAVDAVSNLVDQVDVLREENRLLMERLQQAEVRREAAEFLRRAEADRLAIVEASRIETLAKTARSAERASLTERRIAELEAELTTKRGLDMERTGELAVLRLRLQERHECAIAGTGPESANAGLAATRRPGRRPSLPDRRSEAHRVYTLLVATDHGTQPIRAEPAAVAATSEKPAEAA